jgi:NAD(P) transhydrogenase subunit alpha
VVSAFDVRAAAKEQVESLGAKFIEVPAEESGEAAGGYAKEMSEEYKKKQSQLIADTIKKQDLVISTALIPGRPAPVLITEDMVKDMKKGSIIVDLAAASGGNCPLTEADKVVVKHGVTLIGYTNMPGRCAVDASALYARNLFNFVSTLLIAKEGGLAAQWDDELVKGTLLTKDGTAVHPNFK